MSALEQEVRPGGNTPPGLVEYRSYGSLLIIGPADRAVACGRRLADSLACSLLTDSEPDPADTGPRPPHIRGRVTDVQGYMGAFRVQAQVNGEGEACNLAERFGFERVDFDLILDLGAEPQLRRQVPPPGYFAPVDETALERALADLPDMIGDFEKPRYFLYDPSICAHGDSGQVGCTRCLDACAAEAIVAEGDRIDINPWLCQGCGACATACPTGAVSYNYPDRATLIDDLRQAIAAVRQPDTPLTLVLHDRPELAPVQDTNVLPYALEDLASAGLEVWLSALAYGARRVLLVAGPQLPEDSRQELNRQLDYARAIITPLGLPAEALAVVEARNPEEMQQALAEPAPAFELESAGFAGLENKREQLNFAIDHLYRASGQPLTETDLPAGAPFGAVEVDREACTLCMTCVGVCPVNALEAGGDRPQLNFIEANCVQCGLCEAACPEDAIDLKPRLIYDYDQSRSRRTVNEEQPFGCISCGKPFATVKMIEVMLSRLADHWMFQNERALSRLKMCEECRVRDVLADEGAMNAVQGARIWPKPDSTDQGGKP